MKVTLRAEARGNGPLTAPILREAIAAIPDEAHITVRTSDSQIEGQSWFVTAQWLEERD